MTKENQEQEDLVLSINLSDAQRKLSDVLRRVRKEAPAYIESARSIAHSALEKASEAVKSAENKINDYVENEEKDNEKEEARRNCCRCPHNHCR